MYAIRPWLFLGKFRETQDIPLLQFHHIGAMLQLAGQIKYNFIESLYIPIEDGIPIPGDILQRGVDFILAEHRQGKNVMVSCGAGISRSVTFIIAALKETENSSLLDAYQTVKDAYPGALPHPALWKSLCGYYREDTPYWLLLKKYNHNNLYPS